MTFREFRLSLIALGVSVSLALLGSSCDGTQTDAVVAKPPAEGSGAAIVRLPADVAARIGIAVQPVAPSEFRTHREFSAVVQPNQHAMADITTLVRGRVVDAYADLGQQVEANTLLAILYSSELGLAQSGYLKAQAKLHVAEQAYKRAKFLLQEKVIGEAELERRNAEWLSMQAEAHEARDRLKLLGMTDEELHRLDRSREIRSYVPIVAPFDGRVIARNLTKGEVVETTEKLFTVADLSEVWVLANIPEKDIPYIHPDGSSVNQSVEVLVNAYPNQVFHGTITYVGDVLDAATRTMSLRLKLPNQDKRLKPEMFATVRVHSQPEPGVLTVPEAAVQRDRDRRLVFVRRDEQSFEARDVTLGESNGQDVKILDGLREGEHIVVKGAYILKSELLSE